MKRYIVKSYKRVTQAQLNTFATIIATRMSEDSRFSALNPSLDELKRLNLEFEVALAKAAKGGVEFTAIKNRCKEYVIEQLDNIAYEVDKMAKGDTTIFDAAGFVYSKEPDPITDLLPPTGLTVVNVPRSGSIRARWDAQDGAINYAISHQIKGETEWRNGTFSSKREVILAGFKPGDYVSVKLFSIGRGGMKSDYTVPVGEIVL